MTLIIKWVDFLFFSCFLGEELLGSEKIEFHTFLMPLLCLQKLSYFTNNMLMNTFQGKNCFVDSKIFTKYSYNFVDGPFSEN